MAAFEGRTELLQRGVAHPTNRWIQHTRRAKGEGFCVRKILDGCITGADEPLSQRVNKRSREYIFKMSLRVVCIVCAVLVDGWMRWAFVAGSAVLPWAAVVIANGEAKNRNSGFVPYKHNVPQLALTASMQGQDSGKPSYKTSEVIDLQAHPAGPDRA